MAWKTVRNSEPDTRVDTFTGKCPRFNRDATVSVHLRGTVAYETDLQKTYHYAGMKCDLLKDTNEASSPSCAENCPLIPKEHI